MAPSTSDWLLNYGVFPQNPHHIIVTHNTECQESIDQILLVSFLMDDYGQKCKAHPFGCGNAFIEQHGNGVCMLVRLQRVEATHLAGYDVNDDGMDSCCVCLAA